jgi:hypothetical protein
MGLAYHHNNQQRRKPQESAMNTVPTTASALTVQLESMLPTQSAQFVEYSDVREFLLTVAREAAPDFDPVYLDAAIGNKVTWGDSNRTMVPLYIVCDAIRSLDVLTESEADALSSRLSAVVSHTTYIDMEN